VGLSTKWAGEVTVPVAEILKREPLPAAPAVKAGEAKPAAAPPPPPGGLANSAPRPGTALVSGPLPPTKPKPKRLSGEAQVGVDLVFSEKQRQLYSGRFKVGYVYDPQPSHRKRK